jgi:hypothetical protein
MGLSQQIGASSLIKPGVIDNTAARPASPYEGQVIFQKDTDQLLVWNGTAWVIPNSPAQNPQGLELVKTQTVGSEVSTVEVTGAFNSTYNNYLVHMAGGTMSTTASIAMRLGGSTTGYYGFMPYGASDSNTILGSARSNQVYMYWLGGTSGAGQPSYMRVELFSPYLAQYTRFVNGAYQDTLNFGIMNGEHRVATSYDSFTLIPGSGTLTGGTIRVYGYRNS